MILRYFRGLFSASKKGNDEVQERNLLFQQAVFQSSEPERVEFKVNLKIHSDGSTVSVEGSGVYSGSYERNENGAETFKFATKGAEEEILVSATGQALWQMEYRDPEKRNTHVIAFCGELID